jgi:phosphoribosylamine--glycine ligase
MKILVIGSGGREHAITWSAARSKKAEKIFCAPGNPGTAELAENVDIKADDIEGLLKFALENKIDLTIVGPEVPLVMGIVDLFAENGLKAFGPSEDGAQMEGSKVFTKNLFKKYNIPTADFGEFDSSTAAIAYIKANKKYPMVVKADGLAAGKGVIIAKNELEAITAVADIMTRKIFGGAGDRVVIEEFLEGEEASILAFTDGETVLPLPASQDHKRIFDDDKGPNTGGMGAYAPAPVITPEILKIIMDKILYPTVKALKSEGIIYKGILYAGIMMTASGPKVLEYNVRFGDPETQAVLPLLKTDLIDLCMASIDGKLKDINLEIEDRAAINVVLASKGYPGEYEKGKEITGFEKLKDVRDIIVFHAGTALIAGKIVTAGGRVLNVTALGGDIKDAVEKVYKYVDSISFEGVYYRKDIGKRAIRRTK